MLGLLLKNEGPTDIVSGRLVLGIEEEFLEVMGWNQDGWDMGLDQIDYYTYSFSIDGKTMVRPDAREGIAVIRMFPHSLPGQTETHTSLVTATVCYDYKTILNQEVCVESDVFGTRYGVKVCESQEISLSSQGGPVAITKITPTMHSSEDGTRITPEFKLTIQDAGRGTVISSGSQRACSASSIDKNEVNEIRIHASLFNQRLTCRPERFRLDDSLTAEVRCELGSGIEAIPDAYMSMLVVELDYGYTQTISKQVRIQKNY